jgi:hypothetical protein
MFNAGASLGSMLAINSTLDSLNLNSTDLGPNGVEALLQPLTGHATARPPNKSLTHLTIVVAKGERRLQWSIGFGVQAMYIYIGRRLQCRDEDVTTLTPGFFPRVQVRGLSKHIYFSIHIQHLM